MATNKTYKDYKTIMQVIEIEKGKYMMVGVVNKVQLDQLYKIFEPLSREWRGQYQALAKAVVGAYEKWKKGN